MLEQQPRDKAELDAQFADLYRSHLRDVYSYSYYRVGNHHDAEDLTEQTFLQAWQVDADFMKRQPGFISTQLHRAIGESPTYLNYAVWESTSDFRAAFTHPEFRAKLSAYPSSAVASPHLFQKVAVPGICVA